ncbi:protein TIC 40, chloroplastic [Humulus lupulus]|uniref:protein TIC 40, chloroplastic n=1 Tax=Humulus lupulus TaxID=3486 RepID=UPI002B411431|nr:protein TIC 40, chloroplastic [Humulus lupulus]
MVTMPLSMSLSLSHSLNRPYIQRPSSSTAPLRFRYSSSAAAFTLRPILSHSRPSRFSTIIASSSSSDKFASIFSSSSSQQTSSVGVTPQPVPPSPSSSQLGSPLFWIGVGVGLSALFSWVAGNLKKYAMQQALKTMMGQMDTQNSPFSNPAFSPGPGTPFPFPSAAPPRPASSPPPSSSQSSVTVDVAATKVEAAPATRINEEPEEKKEAKKIAFVDVSPEETTEKSPFESSIKDAAQTSSFKDSQDQVAGEVYQNGTTSNQGFGPFGASNESQSTQKGKTISVEALEKMMEDPTVQKMVYPYLPEEMRNPTTFKWMLQNPQYRSQLEEMLTNMSGNTDWDNRVMDSLKNFDLSSPEVKQQFDQIGLTPEEVISKIMANPDVAMAFQNPRVQQAIMDCSQNPLSIAKYQNDKEVMDVFNKISELFPGVSGSP